MITKDMWRMLATGLLLVLAAALGKVALADGEPAFPLGPCDPLQTHMPPKVADCYHYGDCLFWCDDPCGEITYSAGTCNRVEGPCSEFASKVDAYVCRECSCEQSHCWEYPLYLYGSKTVTKCANIN